MGLCGNFAHLSTGALIITECLDRWESTSGLGSNRFALSTKSPWVRNEKYQLLELYGGQLPLSIELIKPYYLIIPLIDEASQFKLTPFKQCNDHMIDFCIAKVFMVSSKTNTSWAKKIYVSVVILGGAFGWVNPLTPRSDWHATSPYNIHTLSSKQVMRILKLIRRSFYLDLTPNSRN